MINFFLKIPASALFKELDGNTYAVIHLAFSGKSLQFEECAPRMVKATGCQVVDGYALVPLARVGDKIARFDALPEGVTYTTSASDF